MGTKRKQAAAEASTMPRWKSGVAVGCTDGLADTLREKYTLCKPCCVEDTPDAHTVWLRVGVQSFCVTSYACDTKEEAEWMRAQLANALAVLVSANNQAQARRTGGVDCK